MFVQNLFPHFFSKGLLPIFVKKKKKSTLLLNSQESPGEQEDETSQF